MRTITLDNGKRIMYVCPSCSYVYEVKYDENDNETVVLRYSDHGDKPFIQLLDKNLIQDEPRNKIRNVNLYACPRCLTVQLDSAEIDN